MQIRRSAGIGVFGMLGLGVCYFAWYTPYSALAKSLSGGLLPGVDGPVGGLVLLPAAALGMLAAMPLFLLGSGWWRHARTRGVGRLRVPVPGRETAASAFWMSLVVGTTTLNFTFTGFSIVFMLVMMRLETIILAPVMDLIRRRRIRRYSWVALGLSLLAALVAFADVTSYRLTIAAFASLVAYLIGYTGRFEIMSRHAKTGDPSDRRYFVEEHMSTPVILTALLAIPALIDQGPAMHALHVGFTTFLTTPAAAYALAIGVCYEGLFIFTTLIFMDRREYAFCMPVHVCASLLAGIAAALGMRALFGTRPPSPAQFTAAAFVVAAAVALSYPALRAWLSGRRQRARAVRTLLFVCGANTGRSAMAEAIASAELSVHPEGGAWRTGSAGLSAVPGGAAIAPQAAEALRQLGVVVTPHRSRRFEPAMCADGVAVYCMTLAQQQAIVALAPEAGGRTFRLDPDGDIPDPSEDSTDGYLRCAERIRTNVRARIGEHLDDAAELYTVGG